MLKVFILPTQNNGCGKYRMWSPSAALERSGLVEIRRGPDDPEDITVKRCEAVFEWADVVYTQCFTELWSSSFFLSTRDYYRKKLIVDLDDSIWDVHPMNVGTINDRPFKLNDHFSDDPMKFWEMHQMTDEQWRAYVEEMPEEDRAYLDKPTFLHGTMLELQGKKTFVKQKNADARSSAQIYLRNADAVTTTNPWLRERIRQHTGQENIFLTPNCLTATEWHKAANKQPGEVWIGWSGSVSHYPDLKFLVPVLDKLMAKYPQLRIQIMGSCFDYLFPPKKGADHQIVGGYGGNNTPTNYYKFDDAGERWPGRMRFDKPVPVHEYPRWMSQTWQSDIAIAPLDNNNFNEAKSELKWCEYSMLGVPTVASKCGPYKRTIRHNVDGKLCGTPQSWQKALEELIESPELRSRLAASATERVLERYDADKQVGIWLDVFDAVMRQQPRPLPESSKARAELQPV